jgi:hypothetical protein
MQTLETLWTVWTSLFSAKIHHSHMAQDHRGRATKGRTLCQFWAQNPSNEDLTVWAATLTLVQTLVNFQTVLKGTKPEEYLLMPRTIALALNNANNRCSRKPSPWPTPQARNTNSLSKLDQSTAREWSTAKVKSNQTHCTSHLTLLSMVHTARHTKCTCPTAWRRSNGSATKPMNWDCTNKVKRVSPTWSVEVTLMKTRTRHWTGLWLSAKTPTILMTRLTDLKRRLLWVDNRSARARFHRLRVAMSPVSSRSSLTQFWEKVWAKMG